MVRKVVFLFFALVVSVGLVAAQAQDCPELVASALVRAQNACADMRRNQACYGYQVLSAELSPGLTKFAFNNVGDITPVDTIRSLHLSAFDPANDQWGVAMMRIRADIPDTSPNQNVTLVAFGSVALEADESGLYQPMQAFTFSSEESTSTCTDVTDDGLLIQTPEGVGRVTLWINQVKIRIGSTVLFQAQPGGDLTVSTFEGSALVEAFGQIQEAVAGTRVRVPMDADLHPIAPPIVPEPFYADTTGLDSLLSLSQFFTDDHIPQVQAVDALPRGDVPNETVNHPVVDEIGTVLTHLVIPMPDAPASSNQAVIGTPDNLATPPVTLDEDITQTPDMTSTDTDEVDIPPTVAEDDTGVATPGTAEVTPGDDTVVTPITPTSDPQDDLTPVPPPDDTNTPEAVATPSPDEEVVVTPTSVGTDEPSATAEATIITPTPTKCNRNRGNSSASGNCYGYTQ